ncbi:hypothetical protein AFULGI_00025030 [Archaeoglobus fulgidus DSM 8774]|uniref:Uncharacterized protein n=1 Tax=Archaeoglobus fulgidus DSM 8774 TaxID=1344584 RepID=A0A075WNS4_ARCFL|nr:hypothetical protein [Archaeoglobus fulgidus]AIG99218.1 hypothetical protein AFULGI_00025030 [Archaeoglobus fulgidus DSM 8774]
MRKYLIGKKYELEKKDRLQNLKQFSPKSQNATSDNLDTARKIATEFNVDRATVFRAEKFAKAVDKLAEVAGEEVKERILPG